MNVSIFSTKVYDKLFFTTANNDFGYSLTFFEEHLCPSTLALARDTDVVCIFVNDHLNASSIKVLSEQGVKMIALRCAGFNNVDLIAAKKHNIRVVRVPTYSPYAVAEHTVALMLSLNRQIHRAHTRVREGNFALEGLLGFDMHGRTVGIIGTGKIGRIVASIMKGFGCKVLGYDLFPSSDIKESELTYVPFEELLAASDIISLHCPLTPQTQHIIDEHSLAKTKKGVMIINTGRGALVDTAAVLAAVKSGQIGYLGLDVYEEEADLFFEDLSNYVLQDDVFARLLTFPNVIVTGHQAFFTKEALTNIANTTLQNISAFNHGELLANEVSA